MPVGGPVMVRKPKQRNGELLLFGASGSMNRVPFQKSRDYLGFCHLTSPFPSAHPSALPLPDLIPLSAFLFFFFS